MNLSSLSLSLSQVLEIGTTIILATLVLSLLDLAAESWANPLDRVVDRLIVTHRTPEETRLMRVTSGLGGPYGITIGSALLTAVLLVTRGFHTAALFFLVVAASTLYVLCLKRLTARKRPKFRVLQRERSLSFPSAHTLVSTTLYLGTGVLLDQIIGGLAGEVFLGVTILLILAIGFSRIYLGSHYFSDVIGGLIGGATWVGILILLLGHL